jgi:hypothetical protein
MKITKKELAQIIKEEVSQILSEERMSEIGKRDAAEGLDPSPVGAKNSEYMAGYNEEKKAIRAALEKDAEWFNTLDRDMQEQEELEAKMMRRFKAEIEEKLKARQDK